MPTKGPNKAAKEQLRLDFEAATHQFCIDEGSYRMFCLGVTMCMLTMKGVAEEAKKRFEPGQSAEQAAEMYYEAARLVIHAR